MLTLEQKNDVKRNLGNFAKIPGWHTIMLAEQVDYLYQTFDDSVFCRGYLRKVVAMPLTGNSFKVYTEPYCG